MDTSVVVVGIGADGWDGLDEARRAAVRAADVVLGGERHLALVPADVGAERLPWPAPLREQLPTLLEGLAGRSVVALASGDPFVAGIGTTLVDVLGPEAVHAMPAVSSVSLARARMRWSEESSRVLRVVGDEAHQVLAAAAPGARLLVLCSDGSTPRTVARLLADAGLGLSALSALSDLGSDDEARVDGLAATWDVASPDLTILAVDVRSAGAPTLPLVPGLPDDVFEHDGQLTKRDVRASALARLAPTRGGLLWDVGAGAGSVAVEWARTHPTCRVVAVERDPERADRVGRNARRLGVPHVEVVTGSAPDVLGSLPSTATSPDAVFVGGGATTPGLLDACWDALAEDGRIVVHGVTLETEQVLASWYSTHGGELTRLTVEHVAPIGTFSGWTPARAITQWAATKPRIGTPSPVVAPETGDDVPSRAREDEA